VLRSRGIGFLYRQSEALELREAIHWVCRRRANVYPADERRHGCRVAGRSAKAVRDLSDRERQVLRFTAEGFTGVEIGARLGISPKSVDTYLRRAMDKLEIRHRSGVVGVALEPGLLSV
jgi:DNA-binding CsgD family transcriptional regulator